MESLAVSALLGRRHEDVLGGEERKLHVEPAPDDGGMDDETVRHRIPEEQDRVGGKERFGEGEAPIRGIVESPLEPLGCMRPVAVVGDREQPAGEGVHPLALHRVPFVGHRGRPDLLLPERLLDFLHVLKEADVVRELRGRRREAREGGKDEGVLLARVRLAGDEEAIGEARLLGDEPVEALGLVGVAVEERHERGLCSGCSLAAEEAQLVGPAHQLAVIEGEVLKPEARALAHRGGLRGLEMREAEAGEVAVRARESGEPADDAHGALREEPERLTDDEKVGVVSDEGRCRPEVQDSLRRGRDLAEGVEMGHDVVLRLALVPVGGRELRVGGHEVRPKSLERGLRNGKPELPLGLREPEPELSPRRELRPCREERGHLGRGVAAREGIFVAVDGRVAHGVTPRSRRRWESGIPSSRRYRRRCRTRS